MKEGKSVKDKRYTDSVKNDVGKKRRWISYGCIWFRSIMRIKFPPYWVHPIHYYGGEYSWNIVK